MMIRCRVLLALVAILLSVPAASTPQIISMVELIIRPESYVGKEIQIFGFNIQRRVYLTQDSARYRDFTNSVSFSDPREGFYDFCEEQFVRVTGRLSRGEAGDYFLQDVSSVHSMKYARDCAASVKFKYKHHEIIE